MRFYGILDTGYTPKDQWEKKCEALIKGGSGIIQVRAKKESNEELYSLAQRAYPICQELGAHFIINDNIECSLEFPEAGLHIGQDDMDPIQARNQLGPKRVLGLSTHSIEQAQKALEISNDLSYFAVGPVFSTQTKPDYIPVGLTLVQQVSELKPVIPFFCIGGINRSNVQTVIDHGAPAVVAVSDVLCDENTQSATREFIQVFD